MKQNKFFTKTYATLVGTQILSMLLAAMILLTCLSACGNNEQLPKRNDTNTANEKNEQQSKYDKDNNLNPENTVNESKEDAPVNIPLSNNISILSIESPDEGCAVITFSIDGVTYYGIMNSKGEIIYYSESTIEKYRANHYAKCDTWSSAGNGCGFITTRNKNDKRVFIIFNKNGDIAMTVTEGDAFDAIIGYGEGLLLVYKNTSTITKEEHSYGVLTCDGVWKRNLTPGDAELRDGCVGSIKASNYKYYGEGIFVSEGFYNGSDYITYKLLDINSFKLLEIYGCWLINDNFINGVVYGGGSESTIVLDIDMLEQTSEDRMGLPRIFALNAKGEFKEVKEDEYPWRSFDNLLVYMNPFAYLNPSGDVNPKYKFMSILNLENNTMKEYNIFTCNMIRDVTFVGDYGLIVLVGADEKTYFTIIDKECNEIVKPICCETVHNSEGRIVFSNDGVYEMMDFMGNYIIDKNQGYTDIQTYSGGIAKAKNGNDELFIDLDGNPITIKLK